MTAYVRDVQTIPLPAASPSTAKTLPDTLPVDDAARRSGKSSTVRYDDLPPMLAALHREDAVFKRVTQVQHYKMGEQVASAEKLEKRMLILMQGRVNLVCTSPTQRQLVITTLEPGAIFGRGGLFEADDSNTCARAADDVVIWDIPARDARDLTMRYPILSWGLLQTHSERLSQVQKNLENVACKKLPERLADLLLQLGNYRNGVIEGYCHQTLANYLGTYRETVSAALREFKRRGFIEIGYCRLKILQVERLKEIAGVWE